MNILDRIDRILENEVGIKGETCPQCKKDKKGDAIPVCKKCHASNANLRSSNESTINEGVFSSVTSMFKMPFDKVAKEAGKSSNVKILRDWVAGLDTGSKKEILDVLNKEAGTTYKTLESVINFKPNMSSGAVGSFKDAVSGISFKKILARMEKIRGATMLPIIIPLFAAFIGYWWVFGVSSNEVVRGNI